MTSVVIVHSDPRSTIRLLEAAGFRVEVAGQVEVAGYDRFGPARAASNDEPSAYTKATPRTVLVVSQAAEVAA